MIQGLTEPLSRADTARTARLLQVFNRYLHTGGEEKSVDRIFRHLSERHTVERCFFDSAEWKQRGAPGALGQAMRLFYNKDSAARFEAAVRQHQPDFALFHNLYPVASPALYHASIKSKLPVIQYLHNFRPFCVSGTAYARGQILSEAIQGHWWREVKWASWQSSVAKSALFAVMLKMLHASGWLRSVKAWIAISEFMRQRVIEAGVPENKVHTLRHSWDAMNQATEKSDKGYYLFLGRLVESKGIETMLEAWQQFHTARGDHSPELHIAGEGPLEPLVRERVRHVPSIRYLGLISGEAKHEALAHCRAVLVPSVWWEPLGLVVYEAYDYGKAVLAAWSGGLTETVIQSQTGFLHQPGDPASLLSDVQAFESMSSDQRHAMGSAGRHWLLAHTAVNDWQNQFDHILKEAGRA